VGNPVDYHRMLHRIVIQNPNPAEFSTGSSTECAWLKSNPVGNPVDFRRMLHRIRSAEG
jgi:hypothetical protein